MTGRPGIIHCFPSCAIRLLLTQFVLLALFIGPAPARAQVLYGSLTGTVTDSAGAVIPNAAVTVTNQGTGEVRATQSDAQGNYELLDVLPGAYTVSVKVAVVASMFPGLG